VTLGGPRMFAFLITFFLLVVMLLLLTTP